MKDTVQELVDALYVRTTSILERIRDTWILRLKLKPGTSDIFLTLTNSHSHKAGCRIPVQCSVFLRPPLAISTLLVGGHSDSD